jgi:hypothetical protein
MALALYTARSATAALLWDCYPPALIRLFQSGFMIGWFLAPALFGHFCRIFVGPRPSAGSLLRRPGLFYVMPMVALVVLHVPAFAGVAMGSARWLLWYALAASWLGTLAMGLTTLVRARSRVKDLVRRRQLEFVLAGSLAYALVVLHAFETVRRGWDLQPSAPWAWLPHLLLFVTPLAFAYAILRHRLLDLDVVVRRSLVYALLTLSMAGVFVALQHLASTMLELKTGASSLPAQTLAALVVAALFAPTERRIKQGVETLFNRRQIQRLDGLRRLGREVNFWEEGEGLERSLLQRLVDVLEIERAALFWLDREHGEYRLLAETGPDGMANGSPSFPRDGALAVWLEAESVPLHFAGLPQDLVSRRLDAEEHRRLAELDTALAVPLAVRGQLLGFLLLGACRDHDLYSPEVQETLLAIGSLAAAALEHIALTRCVRDLERMLHRSCLALGRKQIAADGREPVPEPSARRPG